MTHTNPRTESARTRSGGAEHTLRWVLAHEPPVVFDEAAKVFEDEIRRRSGGAIAVELVRADEYAAQRGQAALSRAELVASVQRGEVEMAHCYVSALGAVHERLWAIELPFLFRDYAHAEAVWEGPVAARLMDGLPDVGLRGVAFAYSGGFRVVATRDRVIQRVADYQGLRLRTAGNPIPEALYRRLGGSAVAAPLEAIPALARAREGGEKIDGCEITFVRYLACGLDDVFPIINVTGHSLFSTMTVMNDAWFRGLPDRYQEIVVAAGEAACRVERETAIREEQVTREALAGRGFRIVDMDEAARAELRRVAEALYEQFAPRFGEALIDAIRTAGAGAAQSAA